MKHRLEGRENAGLRRAAKTRRSLAELIAARVFPGGVAWKPSEDRLRAALHGPLSVLKTSPGQREADIRAAVYLEGHGFSQAARLLRARSHTAIDSWWTERRVRVLELLAEAGADVPTGEHGTLDLAALLIAVARTSTAIGLRLWTHPRELSPAQRVAVTRAAIAYVEQILRAL